MKPVRRKESQLWLILSLIILLLAAGFRIVALDEVPPGLAQDEVLDADIAGFILSGEHALFFRHGYGHEPLYHYLAAPFQLMFGDNILGIRLPSVYLGLFLVALTMRWAKREFGIIPALIAGSGLAISWWPVIFSRIGIRPILEPVFLVAAMWFWPLRKKTYTRGGVRLAAVAGLLLGLSIYTYTAARIILLIPLLFLVVQGVRWLLARQISSGNYSDLSEIRAQLSYGTIALAVGALVYIPLALTLSSNPDLQQRLEQLEGPLTALQAGDLGPVLQMTVATLGVVSFSGDPRWTYSLPDRTLFDPFTSIFFYVGLILVIWRWRTPIFSLLPIWLFVALLPSALSPDAPSTVRLIGALPVVYLLPGLAIDAIISSFASRQGVTAEAKRWGTILGGVVLAILLGLNSYRTIRDGFVLWPADLETRLRYQTALRDMARHWMVEGDDNPPVITEVFFEPIDDASFSRNVGFDPEARWIQSGAGVAGAVVWPAGARANLYVPEYAPLHPELIEWAGLNPQPVYRSPGQPSFAVNAMPDQPQMAIQPMGVEFGSEVIGTILGVGLPEDGVSAQDIRLASLWQVDNNWPADIAIFVHLIDEAGNVVAQHDGLDTAAITLQRGDIILQRHVLLLPTSMEKGVYTLQIGLYQRTDNQRILQKLGGNSLEFARCEVGLSDSQSPTCSLTASD